MLSSGQSLGRSGRKISKTDLCSSVRYKDMVIDVRCGRVQMGT